MKNLRTVDPSGWRPTTLGAVVRRRGETADPRSAPKAEFLRMDHIESHTTRLLGSVPSASMKSVANVFEAGDVLYGRLRPYLNKVYLAEFSGYCSTEFIVMPENRHISGKFLKYRLNSDEFVRFANGINTGDRPRVKFDQIASFRFLLPPMTEQIRVVGVLDDLFSELDAGIAALVRSVGAQLPVEGRRNAGFSAQLMKIRALRQSILQRVLSGGLDLHD